MRRRRVGHWKPLNELPMHDRLANVNQVARILRLSRRQVYRHIERGSFVVTVDELGHTRIPLRNNRVIPWE